MEWQEFSLAEEEFQQTPGIKGKQHNTKAAAMCRDFCGKRWQLLL